MKRPHSVGYFSSYDRGLSTLLDMWPKIKEQVPDATLDIYYGWNAFDHAHAKNPQMMKWKWQMIRKMADVGAIEHGRVSHQELAKAMKEIQVWAYPTEFTEISCITAMKAQAAGMHIVTTGCYALAETVQIPEDEVTDIYTNEAAQAKFIERVVAALNSPPPKKVEADFSWAKVAKGWDAALA